MVKLGLIAFANDGGLGAQTRRLAQVLNPDRILLIDSSGFSMNKQQHYEWYDSKKTFLASQFPPSNSDIKQFLKGLTHVLVCENPYNFGLVHWGKEMGVKIFVQSNYEFCDNLSQPWLPVPDKFLMPSYWMIDEMKEKFGAYRVKYLPPPIEAKEFERANLTNINRRGKKRRFLHVIGTAATQDRNGTYDVLESVKLAKEDFELVIRSQHNLSMGVFLDDPRVKYEVGNLKDNQDLYEDFDALLLPRRWGGLCLTMCEALACSLPVLMSDITPNKEVLPEKWLCPANREGTFMTRAEIPFYTVSHNIYADMIDTFAKMSDEVMAFEKGRAFGTFMKHWDATKLKAKYLELFNNG